jgi:transposase-like protein
VPDAQGGECAELPAEPVPAQGPENAARHPGRAETRKDALMAFALFTETCEPKYPRATECLEKDRDELLTFHDFPTQHGQSIRTSNPIESTFAAIRHRTRRTKGCPIRDGMLHMMFKLAQCAEKSWRKPRGCAHLAGVIEDLDLTSTLYVMRRSRGPLPCG